MIYCSFFCEKEKNKVFQHQTAHSLLAHALELEYHIHYSAEMLSREKNGKPFLTDFPAVHFNLSHCKGGAACIIDSVPVGIDIENIRPFNEQVAKKVCTEKELEFIFSSADTNRSFFKLWTLKESVVKTTGEGLRAPFKEYEFLISPDGKVTSNHPQYSFSVFEHGNFIISTCKTGRVNI